MPLYAFCVESGQSGWAPLDEPEEYASVYDAIRGFINFYEPRLKEVCSHVDLELKSYNWERKINAIKEVRAITGLGLKEAKDLVESSMPQMLRRKVPIGNVKQIMKEHPHLEIEVTNVPDSVRMLFDLQKLT